MVTLRTKFTLITITLILLPILTVTFFTIEYYNSVLTSSYYEKQNAQLQTTMLVMKNISQRLRSLTRQLSIDNTLMNTLRLRIFPQMEEYLERIALNNNINSISIYDSNKFLLVSYPEGIEKTFRWNKNKFHDYYIQESKLKEAYVLPIYRQREVLGYVELVIDLVGEQSFSEFNILERLKELFGGTLILVSRGNDLKNAVTYEELTIGKIAKIDATHILLNRDTYIFNKFTLPDSYKTINIYILNNVGLLTELLSSTRNRIIFMAIIVMIVGLIVALAVSINVTSRIHNISQFAKKIAGGVLKETLPVKSGDELGELSESMNTMSQNLLKAKTEAENRQREIEDINLNLERRVQEEIVKNRDREHLMFLQSRHAAMGEMIGNIGHQWRQPLNTIGLIIQSVNDEAATGKLDKDFLNSATKKAMELVKHMSHTIDDFRNFFSPSREKEDFKVVNMVNQCLSLIDAAFRNNFIDVEQKVVNDVSVSGYSNEYKQVILNVLNNAKDALGNKADTERRVKIKIFSEKDNSVVTIRDNGGGIPDKIIDKIFEPYFTTRASGGGTGLGLYMARVIIETHMGGSLSVQNVEDGALFRIEVPLEVAKV